MCLECSTKDRRGKSRGLNPRESGLEVVLGPGVVTTSTTLLGFVSVRKNHGKINIIDKKNGQTFYQNEIKTTQIFDVLSCNWKCVLSDEEFV